MNDIKRGTMNCNFPYTVIILPLILSLPLSPPLLSLPWLPVLTRLPVSYLLLRSFYYPPLDSLFSNSPFLPLSFYSPFLLYLSVQYVNIAWSCFKNTVLIILIAVLLLCFNVLTLYDNCYNILFLVCLILMFDLMFDLIFILFLFLFYFYLYYYYYICMIYWIKNRFIICLFIISFGW